MQSELVASSTSIDHSSQAGATGTRLAKILVRAGVAMLLVCSSLVAHRQSSEWVWMGGGAAFPVAAPGTTDWGNGSYAAVYGTKRVRENHAANLRDGTLA